MEARELRIGNIVLDKYENVKYVFAILCDALVFDSDECLILEYCRPIMLTEYWLINFGFQYCIDYNKYCNDSPIYFKKHPEREEYILFLFNCSIGHIKYAHEIQNVYFSITGQELNLKELC